MAKYNVIYKTAHRYKGNSEIMSDMEPMFKMDEQ